MNFVCNLRRLGIYDQLVVAAWDAEMYSFAFKMGVPVFLYRSSVGHSGDMSYGTQAFKKVTKLKSKVVLEILRMGYDVTWTDTDIVWFDNPIPLLRSMESDFVVQSNAPSSEDAANGKLRINSGFYRIRSSPIAISALEAIVQHASESHLTEQPSFYIVLCGGRGGNTKVGDDGCIYTAPPSHANQDRHEGRRTLFVKFLDRSRYPNGATVSATNASSLLWDLDRLSDNDESLVILHNNWIKGIGGKVERLVNHGFW